jgi:pimeloyl-ACP methyl ester carboxylesterase
MPVELLHRDIKASGVRLRVAEVGAGAPVVLLHGQFADHSTWEDVIESLGANYHLVAPDLPGFGASEKPPSSRFAYGVEAFCETIVDLYAALELGPAVVVGHGLGGAIALGLAAKHPELISGLVLVDALCYEAPIDLRRRVALLPLVGGFVLKQLWGRPTFRGYFRDVVVANPDERVAQRIDHYYEVFSSPAARGSALATLRGTVDTRPLVAHTARIAAPTLIVWGRYDRLHPVRLGHRLSREIRGAGLEIFETGHAPHEEQPARFARALGRFLEHIAANRGGPG